MKVSYMHNYHIFRRFLQQNNIFKMTAHIAFTIVLFLFVCLVFVNIIIYYVPVHGAFSILANTYCLHQWSSNKTKLSILTGYTCIAVFCDQGIVFGLCHFYFMLLNDCYYLYFQFNKFSLSIPKDILYFFLTTFKYISFRHLYMWAYLFAYKALPVCDAL